MRWDREEDGTQEGLPEFFNKLDWSIKLELG